MNRNTRQKNAKSAPSFFISHVLLPADFKRKAHILDKKRRFFETSPFTTVRQTLFSFIIFCSSEKLRLPVFINIKPIGLA
jgi:hypothetical protein